MAKTQFVLIVCLSMQILDIKCETRIIGGSDAPDGSAPYQASLRYGNFHFCGGCILNSEWILTAGHCIDPTSPVDVAVGSNYINQVNVIIRASTMYKHPFYDIGLVKLSQPLKFTDVIQPIHLPAADVTDNTLLRITGWGANKYENGHSEAPNALQSLEVYTISTTQCKVIFADVYQERDLCTRANNGHGLCFGDSGSPLVANNQVHGVASRVVPCAIGFPDIYTRVYYSNSWIQNIMSS